MRRRWIHGVDRAGTRCGTERCCFASRLSTTSLFCPDNDRPSGRLCYTGQRGLPAYERQLLASPTRTLSQKECHRPLNICCCGSGTHPADCRPGWSMDHTGNKSLDSDLVATSPEVVAKTDGSYLQLSDAEFRARIRSAYGRLAACDLCPRRCGAHRLAGDTGYCGAALKPKVFVWNLHRGEEPPVSGTRGSGTVFLSGCNLN